MNSSPKQDYWQALERLLQNAQIVIDRPRGHPHPRYPEVIYPLDYGYLEGTTAGDGAGIDIWLGSQTDHTLTGILCTIDTIKRNAEIKILAGCTPGDIEAILHFTDQMTPQLYIPKPQ
jgi:inorganic pyrophosphatase